MIAERLRIALDAAVAGSNVGHLAGRGRVAGLARLPLFPGGAVQPFGVGAVNVDAENRSLMAGSTVLTVAIERGESVFAAVNVVERTEEQLALAGPQEIQVEPAMGEADLAVAHIRDFVAVVTMHAAGRNAGRLADIEVVGVFQRHGWGVAGRADTRAFGTLAQQTPADVW